MNSLNGIDLGDLVLHKQLNPNISMVVEISDNGREIIYAKDQKFRKLLLYGGDNWGLISNSVMEQLQELGEVFMEIYELIYQGTSYMVRFRNEEESIKGTPFNPHIPTSDFNNVEILLMEEII